MLGVFMQRTLGNLHRPEDAEVQAVVLMLISSVVGALYIATMLRQGDGR